METVVDANKIKGVFPISNTGSLVIHEIDYTDDRVLVSLNGQNPEWCDFAYKTESENEIGFKWGELFVPFSEVMRF